MRGCGNAGGHQGLLRQLQVLENDVLVDVVGDRP